MRMTLSPTNPLIHTKLLLICNQMKIQLILFDFDVPKRFLFGMECSNDNVEDFDDYSFLSLPNVFAHNGFIDNGFFKAFKSSYIRFDFTYKRFF